MNKNKFVALIVWVATLFPVSASPQQVCTTPTPNIKSIKIGVFNGVKTTRAAARRNLNYMRISFGSRTTKHLIPFEYVAFYNQTIGFTDDVLETFTQRLIELDPAFSNRFELFFDLLLGKRSLVDEIISKLPLLAQKFIEISGFFQDNILSQLALLSASPDLAATLAGHRILLDNILNDKSNRVILFGHSQGNLFLNKAYEYALSGNKTQASFVKPIHVAPASTKVYGPATLVQLDLVINGLRPFGPVIDITTSIDGYILRPAGLNNKTDLTGHGLAEIYLNPGVQGVGADGKTVLQRIKGHFDNAIDAFEAEYEAACIKIESISCGPPVDLPQGKTINYEVRGSAYSTIRFSLIITGASYSFDNVNFGQNSLIFVGGSSCIGGWDSDSGYYQFAVGEQTSGYGGGVCTYSGFDVKNSTKWISKYPVLQREGQLYSRMSASVLFANTANLSNPRFYTVRGSMSDTVEAPSCPGVAYY